MMTAVDTSVLLDIFFDDPTFRPRSLAALRSCLGDGPIVACDVVWAEVHAMFAEPDAAAHALDGIPVAFSSVELAAARRAGHAWGEYRRRGGPRTRIVADFIVGAHAVEQADRLLTRDRGFYRQAFAGLAILDPTA